MASGTPRLTHLTTEPPTVENDNLPNPMTVPGSPQQGTPCQAPRVGYLHKADGPAGFLTLA